MKLLPAAGIFTWEHLRRLPKQREYLSIEADPQHPPQCQAVQPYQYFLSDIVQRGWTFWEIQKVGFPPLRGIYDLCQPQAVSRPAAIVFLPRAEVLGPASPHRLLGVQKPDWKRI